MPVGECLPKVLVLAVDDGVEAFLLEDSSHLLVESIADEGHLEEV